MSDSTNDGGRQFCGRTRREFLWQSGGGFAAVALSSLLGKEFFAHQAVAADPALALGELRLEALGAAFPGREVFGVPGRTLSRAGGGVHCVTQHVPLLP